MTTVSSSSTTSNSCYITTELYVDDSNVTWQTTSLSVRIRSWFVAGVPVTDSVNSLAVSGSYSTTISPAVNINYQSGTFLMIDTNATVSLTSSTQTFSISTVLSGIDYSGTLSVSGLNLTIPAKPPAVSQPTLGTGTPVMGSSTSIFTNRNSTSFTHTIRYSFGSATGTIATGVGDSTTWTFPLATLGPQIPAATSGTGYIICDTYSGATLVGTASVMFTASVAASVVPSIGAVVATESVSSVSTIVGAFVKDLTKLSMSLTGCAATGGATIAKTEVILGSVSNTVTNGQNSTSLVYTMPSAITSSGSVTITGKITDSRGRTYTKTLAITVLNYSSPTIASFDVDRCDSAGVSQPLGTYAKVVCTGSVSSLINSTEKNAATYTIYYRVHGNGSWTVLKSTTAGSGLSVNATNTLGTGTFSATSSYDFRLDISDKFKTSLTVLTMGTGVVTLSLNKSGIGIGKVWQSGAIDAQGAIIANGSNFHAKNASGLNAGIFISDSVSDSFRWALAKTTAAESTGNAGSNLALYRYSDAGAYLGAVLTADRASGTVTIGDLVATSFTDSGTVLGSTSNGNYAKFSNGLMICWLAATFTDQSILNAYGPIYLGSRTWTFPVAFKTATSPVVTVGRAQWGTGASWGGLDAGGTVTSASLRFYDYFSRATGTSFYLSVFAVGYWK